MARYELVPYDEANAEVRVVYDDFLRRTGSVDVPIWVQSLGSNVDLLRAYWERTKGSLLHGSLPMILKEMVIFVVSVENGARYCSAAHAHSVLSLDDTLDFEQLSTLTAVGDASVGLPHSHRAALDFAIAVARDPNSVTDDDYAALADADLTDQEIHEIQSLIDLAMMFNSYTSSKQLPLDPAYRPVL